MAGKTAIKSDEATLKACREVIDAHWAHVCPANAEGTRISRDDVDAGRVSDKEIENGVIVPAELQINVLTRRELRLRQDDKGFRRLPSEIEDRIFPPAGDA